MRYSFINNNISNEAYQMLHRVRNLNQNVRIYVVIICRQTVRIYAHYDKTLTPDDKWIFKPNASLETHLYNASRRNASRNDFVSFC